MNRFLNLVQYEQHTFENTGPLGLKLKPLGEGKAGKKGVVVKRIADRELQSLPDTITADMVILSVDEEEIVSKPFEEAVCCLKDAGRPTTLKFASVRSAQAALYTFVLGMRIMI